MPQTNYDQYPALGFSGLIADSGYRNINSHSAQSGGGVGHADNIAFGTGVLLADEEGVGVSIPLGATSPTAVVAGIAVATQQSTQQVGGGNSSEYLLTDAVNVMTKGRVWVQLEAGSPNVSAGGLVYIASKVTSPTTPGAITGADTEILIPSARFVTAGVAGEIVIVEINLP